MCASLLVLQLRVAIADEQGAQLLGGGGAAAEDVFTHIEHTLSTGTSVCKHTNSANRGRVRAL